MPKSKIYKKRRPEGNYYDNLLIDIPRLYLKFPFSNKNFSKVYKQPLVQSLFHKIYQNILIPLKYRVYLWYLLRRTNLDLTWFDQFKLYWSQILKGRPLWGVQDFYFLRNTYRLKFKDNRIPQEANTKAHLGAWQDPGLLYQLFHQVYKESLFNKIDILRYINKYKVNKIGSLLEFGCATAPIITTLVDFYNINKYMKIYVSDIQTLSFHYAMYKFRNFPNVFPILLKPENNFLLEFNKKVDVIFCIEVFEHLNKPLATIKIFHKILEKDGLLIFDYIKSEGTGLNTSQGVRERKSVLEFINKHFHLVKGDINEKNNIYLSVVRKK